MFHISLPFKIFQCVDIGGANVPVNHHQNGQTNSHFGGGDDHDEENEDLSVLIPVETRERSQQHIHRVEHQFDRHEDDDEIASKQHAHHTNRKQNCTQEEVMVDAQGTEQIFKRFHANRLRVFYPE